MNCFGLKPLIDNLIWIHEKLASGPTQQRWKDFNVFAYERTGGPRLLVGLNNDPNNSRTITVATGFGPNVFLHDYSGHSPDLVTDGSGSVTITIPRNQNGSSYVCYSRRGLGGTTFDIVSKPVTQDFEGAPDLDIPPVASGKPITVSRVWCRANSPMNLTLKPDVANWSPNTRISIDVLSPDGSTLAKSAFSQSDPASADLKTTTVHEGFHTLRLTAASVPPANPNPAYVLSATYTAPTVLHPQDLKPADELPQTTNPSQVGQW